MTKTWSHVGAAVTARRNALELSQRQAAEQSGVSPTTWQKVEARHEPVTQRSLRAIARVLQWPQDFADLIMAGTPPDAIPTVTDEGYQYPPGASPAMGMLPFPFDTPLRRELAELAFTTSDEEVRQILRAAAWIRARTYFGGVGQAMPRITLGEYVDTEVDLGPAGEAFYSRKVAETTRKERALARVRLELEVAQEQGARYRRVLETLRSIEEPDPDAVEEATHDVAAAELRVARLQSDFEQLRQEVMTDLAYVDHIESVRSGAEAIDNVVLPSPGADADDYALAAESGDTSAVGQAGPEQPRPSRAVEGYDPDEG